MKIETYNLEILTPCFCAGANPSKAEIRASSIRGQLRWWFRVLGGSLDEERMLFGGVHGLETNASPFVIRIKNVERLSPWNHPRLQPNSNEQYLLYYAKASQDGARWCDQGAIAPGSRFCMEIQFRKVLSPDLNKRVANALRTFLHIGALGLRATRGMGAFVCEELPASEKSLEKTIQELKAAKFLCGFSSWEGPKNSLLNGLGAQLRGLRKGWAATKGRNSNPTPLGSSSPRQSSAVYLRPIRFPEGNFRIFVFEAPHDKILGTHSKSRGKRLANGIPPLGEAPNRKSFSRR